MLPTIHGQAPNSSQTPSASPTTSIFASALTSFPLAARTSSDTHSTCSCHISFPGILFRCDRHRRDPHEGPKIGTSTRPSTLAKFRVGDPHRPSFSLNFIKFPHFTLFGCIKMMIHSNIVLFVLFDHPRVTLARLDLTWTLTAGERVGPSTLKMRVLG